MRKDVVEESIEIDDREKENELTLLKCVSNKAMQPCR